MRVETEGRETTQAAKCWRPNAHNVTQMAHALPSTSLERPRAVRPSNWDTFADQTLEKDVHHLIIELLTHSSYSLSEFAYMSGWMRNFTLQSHHWCNKLLNAGLHSQPCRRGRNMFCFNRAKLRPMAPSQVAHVASCIPCWARTTLPWI